MPRASAAHAWGGTRGPPEVFPVQREGKGRLVGQNGGGQIAPASRPLGAERRLGSAALNNKKKQCHDSSSRRALAAAAGRRRAPRAAPPGAVWQLDPLIFCF